MKLYALKLKETGNLMGFDCIDNDGQDFCVEISYELSQYSNKIWVTPSKEHAEKVLNNTCVYYNADYNSPINNYVGKLEIVEFSTTQGN